MTNSEKLSLADLLVDSASCYKNELRTMFGLRPRVEFEGEIASSSNKQNAENNKQDDTTKDIEEIVQEEPEQVEPDDGGDVDE